MDTLKTITYEVTGRIARIALNRPERGNGITLEMPAEMALAHPAGTLGSMYQRTSVRQPPHSLTVHPLRIGFQ